MPGKNTALTLYRPPKAIIDNRPMLASGFSKSRARGRPRSGVDLPQLVEAYVDPFDSCADGVRYPDDYHDLTAPLCSTVTNIVLTSPAIGGFTDANLINVNPVAGTSLFAFSPDPSGMILAGVNGTNGGVGSPYGVNPGFNWPNGVVFTQANTAANAFGPTSGSVANDSPASNLGTMRQSFSGARVVAGGVKLYSTQNFATVSGNIHVAPVWVSFDRDAWNITNTAVTPQTPATATSTNCWQLQLPNSVQQMAQLPGYVQYPMSALEDEELVSLFKPTGPESRTFKSLSHLWGTDIMPFPAGTAGTVLTRTGTLGNPSDIGHYMIVVYCDGLLTSSGTALPASTAFCAYEWKVHYECQYNGNNSISSGLPSLYFNAAVSATPSPPEQPLLLAAAASTIAEVPQTRLIDPGSDQESSFLSEVSRVWATMCRVATSVAPVITTGLKLAALAL